MNIFRVETIKGSTDQLVICQNCERSFRVDKDWPGGLQFVTRQCPWCSAASSIPGFGAVIYDGRHTACVETAEARILASLGYIEWSPDDGPRGIMWRPVSNEKGEYQYSLVEIVRHLSREVEVQPSPVPSREKITIPPARRTRKRALAKRS